MANVPLNKDTQLPAYGIADIAGLDTRLTDIEDSIGDIGAALDIINGVII